MKIDAAGKRWFKPGHISFRAICFAVLICFCSVILARDFIFIHNAEGALLDVPPSNKVLTLGRVYSYPTVEGIRFDPVRAGVMSFFIDAKNAKDVGSEEAQRLCEYFFTALAVPTPDLWVNLSPRDDEEFIAKKLDSTALGRDLLSQDYVLKQAFASMTDPRSAVGKEFWEKVYSEMSSRLKTLNVAVNTFRRVRVIPEQASVFEDRNGVYIQQSSLQVVIDDDPAIVDGDREKTFIEKKADTITLAVMRDILLPRIKDEVNHGKNFALLRQAYNSIILALWFKHHHKDGSCAAYVDSGNIEGVVIHDTGFKERIREIYKQAYTNGVYNYIRSDYDTLSGKMLRRRYFSGGIDIGDDNFITPAAVKHTPPAVLFSAEVSVGRSEAEESDTSDTEQDSKNDIDTFWAQLLMPYASAGIYDDFTVNRVVCRQESPDNIQVRVEHSNGNPKNYMEKRKRLMAALRAGSLKFHILSFDAGGKEIKETISWENVKIDFSHRTTVFQLRRSGLSKQKNVKLVVSEARNSDGVLSGAIAMPIENGGNFGEWDLILSSAWVTDYQLHRIDILLRNFLQDNKIIGANLRFSSNNKGFERLFKAYCNLQVYLGRTIVKLQKQALNTRDNSERAILDARIDNLLAALEGSCHARRIADYYKVLDAERRNFSSPLKFVERKLFGVSLNDIKRRITQTGPFYNVAKRVIPESVTQAAACFDRAEPGLYGDVKGEVLKGINQAIDGFEMPDHEIVGCGTEDVVRAQRSWPVFYKIFKEVSALAAVSYALVQNSNTIITYAGIVGLGLKLVDMLLNPSGTFSALWNYKNLVVAAEIDFELGKDFTGGFRSMHQRLRKSAPDSIAVSDRLRLQEYEDSFNREKEEKPFYWNKGHVLCRRFFAVLRFVARHVPLLAPVTKWDFNAMVSHKKSVDDGEDNKSPNQELYTNWQKLFDAFVVEQQDKSVDSIDVLTNGISPDEIDEVKRQIKMIIPHPVNVRLISTNDFQSKDEARPLIQALGDKTRGERRIVIDASFDHDKLRRLLKANMIQVGKKRRLQLSIFQLSLFPCIAATRQWKDADSGGCAVAEGLFIGQVMAGDSIMDHVIWANKHDAQQGEILVVRDGAHSKPYSEADISGDDYEHKLKRSFIAPDLDNDSRRQFTRRAQFMTIGDGALDFLNAIYAKVNSLDRAEEDKMRQMSDEEFRMRYGVEKNTIEKLTKLLPPIPQGDGFYKPLVRLFSGTELGKYWGHFCEQQPDVRRGYYSDYGQAMGFSFNRRVLPLGLNFGTFIPSVQSAYAVDLSDANWEERYIRLTRMIGTPAVKNVEPDTHSARNTVNSAIARPKVRAIQRVQPKDELLSLGKGQFGYRPK